MSTAEDNNSEWCIVFAESFRKWILEILKILAQHVFTNVWHMDQTPWIVNGFSLPSHSVDEANLFWSDQHPSIDQDNEQILPIFTWINDQNKAVVE